MSRESRQDTNPGESRISGWCPANVAGPSSGHLYGGSMSCRDCDSLKDQLEDMRAKKVQAVEERDVYLAALRDIANFTNVEAMLEIAAEAINYRQKPREKGNS